MMQGCRLDQLGGVKEKYQSQRKSIEIHRKTTYTINKDHTVPPGITAKIWCTCMRRGLQKCESCFFDKNGGVFYE